jgi:hypothetical protein
MYIVHSTLSLSESCLTVRYHSLLFDLSLHPFLLFSNFLLMHVTAVVFVMIPGYYYLFPTNPIVA